MEVLEALGGESPCTRSHWPLFQLASLPYGLLTWLNPFP